MSGKEEGCGLEVKYMHNEYMLGIRRARIQRLTMLIDGLKTVGPIAAVHLVFACNASAGRNEVEVFRDPERWL